MSHNSPDTKTLLSLINEILFLDVETTTYNRGHPFDPRNKLVSYVYHIDGITGFRHFTDPDFRSTILELVRSNSILCGFNIKFDLHWLRNLGVIPYPDVKVWDLQLGEFILSGQKNRFASLEDTYQSYGMDGKKSHEIEDYWNAGINTDEIPPEVLERRGVGDVQPLPELFSAQYSLLTPKQRKLVWLEGEDLKALADAEYNGIKFDMDKAQEKLTILSNSLELIHKRLYSFIPNEVPAGCFNWDSGDHLSAFLYGGTIEFKYVSEVLTYKTGLRAGEPYNRWGIKSVPFPQRFKPLEGTEVAKTKDDPMAKTRFYQTDGPTLLQLKSRDKDNKEILQLLHERADKTKVAEMVQGIINKMVEKNWEGNMIHPQYNQNVVITGRLSSSQPNMQNQPPEVDELFISRY